MYEIGILGLDTSHPGAFADVLADREGATIGAVWDDGDIRDESHVREFCEDQAATRVEDSADMLGDVDGVMVLTVNWDDHASLAAPFLREGVPTLIDKPVAGDLAGIERIAEAADAGDAPLFGGSAIAFHDAVADLPTGRGAHYCAGYGDRFYYGVHVVDPARRLADADWRSVAPAEEGGEAAVARFENGASATIRLDGAKEAATFGFLSVADRTAAGTINAGETGLEAMYGGYLDAFLECVAGERDDAARVLDAARLHLALQVALDEDRRVAPDDDALADYHAAGAAFEDEYDPPR